MGSVASALIAVNVIGLASQGDSSPSGWDKDYGRALAATRKAQDRPLLVVLDAPAGRQSDIKPVQLIRSLSTARAVNLLAPYVLCHVDVSTDYGQKVAKAFKTTEFPYMAIIDKTGRKIVYQASGPLSDDQWETALTTHKSGEIPHVVPANYLQQGSFGSSYCPSCQRGWR